MDRWEGGPLAGWDSVLQSIATILTTPIGTRVMRREFGSQLPDLVDRPMTSQVRAAIYAATADAIARWEPRFRLRGVHLIETTARGAFGLRLIGDYAGALVEGEVALK